jgi:hypothetical protein
MILARCAIPVLIVVAGLGAAGCGDGDSTSSNEKPGSVPAQTDDRRQNRETYVDTLEPICDRFERTSTAAAARVRQAQQGNDVNAAAAAYRDAAQVFDDFGTELAEVEPPPGDDAPKEIVDVLRANADLVRREAEAVQQQDLSAAQAIAHEINKNTQRVVRLAEGYGMPCPK